MEYKTTIEIVSEAGNKDEAVEIAGEYLSGNLMSGVRMKCRTKRSVVCNAKYAASALVVVMIFSIGILFGASGKDSKGFSYSISSTDAIQPPLRTLLQDEANSKFRQEWKDAETQKALDHIKK